MVQALAYNTVVWLPNALILTGLLLIATFFVWRSRGIPAGLRMLGVSLLPLGLYFIGLWGLLWRVGLAVSHFATGFVLHPTVWLGLILLALGILLLIVPGRIRRLASGQPSSKSSKKAAKQQKASQALTQGRGSQSAPDDDEGLGDVADILKRHGID